VVSRLLTMVKVGGF